MTGKDGPPQCVSLSKYLHKQDNAYGGAGECVCQKNSEKENNMKENGEGVRSESGSENLLYCA